MRYNHVGSVVKKGKVNLEYLPNNNMLADLLTKPLSGEQITKTMRTMGVRPVTINNLVWAQLYRDIIKKFILHVLKDTSLIND